MRLFSLKTEAEYSGFRNTGRYEEVEALCRRFEDHHPKQVRCFEFGRTPENRPMLALAVSNTGALTPDAARLRKIPVLLVQGGIHAGRSTARMRVSWPCAKYWKARPPPARWTSR